MSQDYKKAFEYFYLASQHNKQEGFLYLGKLYYHGYGVKEDKKKAYEYYKLVENQNLVSKPLLSLGELYEDGVDAVMDYEKSLKFYQLSSQENNDKGLLKVGVFYYYGYCVQKIIRKR